QTPLLTIFPYTTLFRSNSIIFDGILLELERLKTDPRYTRARPTADITTPEIKEQPLVPLNPRYILNEEFFNSHPDLLTSTGTLRSEEHTSELQSRVDLV